MANVVLFEKGYDMKAKCILCNCEFEDYEGADCFCPKCDQKIEQKIKQKLDQMIITARKEHIKDKDNIIEEAQDSKDTTSYWFTPVKSEEGLTASGYIKSVVGKAKIYAIAKKTPYRKQMKPGDWICFYAQAKGIVAHARIASKIVEKKPEEMPSEIKQPEKFCLLFRLEDEKLWLISVLR